MTLDSYLTLKLDASYRPLAVVSAKEALVMSVLDKCNVIETWDRKVAAGKHTFDLPSVIALKAYTNKNKTQVKCTRGNIFWRDNHTCQYCGTTDAKMTIDHVIPKSKGGHFGWDNIVTCCEPCNQKKGDRTPEKAAMSLLNKPTMPSTKFIRMFNLHAIKPEWAHYL